MAEPSFSNGFASPWYGGRMKYPDLWRGCVGAWAPILGPTGATLFDMSGFGNHGASTATFGIDRYGWTNSYSGSQSIGVGRVPMIESSIQMTLSAWIMQPTLAYEKAILVKWDYASNGTFGVQTGVFNSAGLTAYIAQSVGDNGTGCRIDTGSVLSANVIHHVALVFNGSLSGDTNIVKFYVDGLLVSSSTGSGSAPTALTSGTANFNIGMFTGLGRFFVGSIGTSAVWNRALTGNEISLIAQRPGIMLELDDSDVWGAAEAGGSVPWWAFANRQSRIIGGGVT